MTELEYIKEFSKITITSACKAVNVNKSNLYHGSASKKCVTKVKHYIDREYDKLKKCYGESEDNSLQS